MTATATSTEQLDDIRPRPRETEQPRGPGLMQLAANFSRSLVGHVADGMRQVSDAEYERRLTICGNCPHKANHRCLQCGCYLAKKARWQSEDCPLKKWTGHDTATGHSDSEANIRPSQPRHPRLRGDLEITRQENGQGTLYLVKDPVSGSFVRFRQVEHFIARQLDGQTPLDDVRLRAEQQFGAALPEETLKGFVEKLWDLKLLESETSRNKQKPRRVRGNLLHCRVKLVDPDRVLGWLAPRLGFIYTQAFLVLSVVFILVATVVFAANWAFLSRALANMLTVQNVLFGLVAVLVITTLHELAHGLTCKRFGGDVHEIGFLLIYFSPAFYCDVSSAWQFPEKTKRLWVTFAGAYFELICWAAAVMTWRLTQVDTWVHRAALVVIAASGLKSFFNLNPLIKLDGYYLLSDALEIPNLRQRAFAYIGKRAKWLLGLGDRPHNEASRSRRWVYFIYGLAAAVYSFGLLSFVILKTGGFLTERYQAGGFVLFASLLVLLFHRTVRRLFHRPAIVSSGHAQHRKQNAGRHRYLRRGVCKMIVLLAVVGGAVWSLFNCKVELKVAGEFEVLPSQRAELRTRVQGLIEEMLVAEGDHVSTGQVVARLSDHMARHELKKVEAEISKQQAQLSALQQGPRPEEIFVARSELAIAKTRLSQAELCLTEARHLKAARLTRATTAVELAESQLELASSKLTRSRSLAERRAVSQADFERVEHERAASEGELTMARCNLQMVQDDALSKLVEARALAEKERDQMQAKLILLLAGSRPEEIAAAKSDLVALKAQRQLLTEQLERTKLVSPIDGIVTTARPEEQLGEHVQPGDSVIEVERLETVSVVIRIPEKEVDAVRRGQQLALRTRACPHTIRYGRVERLAVKVSPASDQDLTPNVRVTTDVANPSMLLKPGMTGKAKIYCGEYRLVDVLTRRAARYFRVEFWSYW